MFDFGWMIGRAKTNFTHSSTTVSLATTSGGKISFSQLVESAIPPCHGINPLLFNGHLQTMWTAVPDPGPPIHYKRQIFESTHSVYPGQFAVDFVVSSEEANSMNSPKEEGDQLPERTSYFSQKEFEELASEDSKPMLICLHGLTGGSHEVYLRQVVAPIMAAGWQCCVINGRGCAQSRITTPQLFNSRATWDIRQLIKELASMFPKRPLYAVGFSLGANILTNYVGEEGEKCALKAAVACSNPWNLEICNAALQRSLLGLEVYSKTMGKNMMGLYQKHKEQILKEEKVDEERVKKCKYLSEFDRTIQAPTWGYPTEGAYYRDSQSTDALLGIRIPFLGINAEDDPISHIEAIPFEEFKQNPYAVLCTTNWGGHLSWFQLGGKRWFADAIATCLIKMNDEIDWSKFDATENVETNGKVPTEKYPIFDPSNRRLILPPA